MQETSWTQKIYEKKASIFFRMTKACKRRQPGAPHPLHTCPRPMHPGSVSGLWIFARVSLLAQTYPQKFRTTTFFLNFWSYGSPGNYKTVMKGIEQHLRKKAPPKMRSNLSPYNFNCISLSWWYASRPPWGWDPIYHHATLIVFLSWWYASRPPWGDGFVSSSRVPSFSLGHMSCRTWLLSWAFIK